MEGNAQWAMCLAAAIAIAGLTACSNDDGRNGVDATHPSATDAPSTTPSPTTAASPTTPASPTAWPDLDAPVTDAIAGWVATEQNSEHIGPCPPGDAPADTIGKWCHLPPREAEAYRIVIRVGAVASGNVWELVLYRGEGDAWEVLSAEKVQGT